MAHILDRQGDFITEGLQSCTVCDDAINLALKLAAKRNESVFLVDEDGNWQVHPNGHIDQQDTDWMTLTSKTEGE